MQQTPSLSSSTARAPASSDPSPAARQRHAEGATAKAATDAMNRPASALGRLAQLAGVRADQQEGQSTAASLEEAVSNAEQRQAVGRDVGKLDVGVEGPREITPPSPMLRSQGTSPSSSSHFYAPSSPYGSTPATLYQPSNAGSYGMSGFYGGMPVQQQQPQQIFYTHTPASPFYSYQPLPYDQALRGPSPTGEPTLASPIGSPMMHSEGFYTVTPAQGMYQPTAHQPGLFYIPNDDSPESQHSNKDAPGSPYYPPQATFSPTQPMAYYGMPAYPTPATYYAQQPAMYAQHYEQGPRRYSMQPVSPAHPLMTSTSSSVYQAQPPPDLTRGHLAQSRLHDAAYNRPPPLRRIPGAGVRSSLPKPPSHSEFALWVGNVPSDSNHAELWRFFTSRTGPAGQGGSTGVESIHLISRSNCAFVNYSTHAHLEHAIKVCHGVSLRPGDPRVKDLVCRVRRKEDDAKSGVGAQRGRGMHQHYVRDQEESNAEPTLPGGAPYATSHSRQSSFTEPPTPMSPSKESSMGGSASTASTTSGFLTKHFKKRYFILKSHTEDDLRLSQERNLWATQPHNEPILDQAWRTASEGVFLVFSANKSGEFFGVAKMAGPIFEKPQKSGSSGSGKSLQPTISEDKVLEGSHNIATSPQPLPSDQKPQFPTGISARPARGVSDPTPSSKPSGLPAFESEAEAGGSAPSHLPQLSQVPPSMEGAVAQLSLNSHTSDQPAEKDGDGIIRRDTLLTPEERNARLEQIADEGEEAGLASASVSQSLRLASEQTAQRASSGEKSWGPGWGRPFKVEWVQTARLPFSRTKHLRNAFNANREVRVARDGTEIEPVCGENLLAEFTSYASAASPRLANAPLSPRAS